MTELEDVAALLGVGGAAMIFLAAFGAVGALAYEAVTRGSITLMIFSVACTGALLLMTALMIDPVGGRR